MTIWDNAFCLLRLNQITGRPTSGDQITDATKYQWLTTGQQTLYLEVARRYPGLLYNAPTQLTTADNKVFTFGTDAYGNAVVPLGKVRVYDSLSAIPDNPWTPGRDYIAEGSQIRMMNNTTRTAPLYAQWVQKPVDITASVQPTLLPEESRILFIRLAAVDYFTEGAVRSGEAADRQQALYNRDFTNHITSIKAQFSSGGARGALAGAGAWGTGTWGNSGGGI